MKENSILILGGYGNTGRLIAHYLLAESNANIILAGRNISKADTVANELNRQFDGSRVKSLALDAADTNALRTALNGINLLVAASSTAQYAEATARACLAAGVDYFDVQYSSQKVQALRSIAAEIENSGLCFITDGGFHPGLPAALIRYAASYFDALYTANVGSVIKVDWRKLQISESTVLEMVGEFTDFSTLFFHDGKWKKGRVDILADTIKMNFNPPFNEQICMPMFLEELRHLPDKVPTLTDSGFFVGGFNPITDNLLIPLMFLILKIAPHKGLRLASRMLLWGLTTFSTPPYGTRLKLEASGNNHGESEILEIILSHDDGYIFTAVPAVATILQLLDATIRKPGLYTQGEIVEPVRLINDMRRMGIHFQKL